MPGGGAYGPLTCKSGYVWREGFDGDGVCVPPDRRQETLNQNAVPQAGPPPPASVGACPPTCLPTTLPVTTPSPTPIAPPAQLPNLLPPPPPPTGHITVTDAPPTSVGPLPTATSTVPL